MSEVGRSLWAGVDLLDRQIIDVNGVPAGKVDDLEFSFEPDPDALPIVDKILCGPAALGRRFGGRLGAAFETLHVLLDERKHAAPASIPMGVVESDRKSVV